MLILINRVKSTSVVSNLRSQCNCDTAEEHKTATEQTIQDAYLTKEKGRGVFKKGVQWKKTA